MATSSAEQQGKPPYSVKVDPGDALELVKQGASLLILDMPEYTILGFDLHMLAVGPLFKGLKMIPPGPHFVYYSATSRHGPNHPFITGFFIHPSPTDVLVRRWDPSSETLIKLSDPDEEERYQASVHNFDLDRHLGPYNLHHYQTWKHLTSYITPQVIERLEPVAGNISVMHEADVADKLSQTTAECRLNRLLAEHRENLANRQAAMEAQILAKGARDGMAFHKAAGNGLSQEAGVHGWDEDQTRMDIDHSMDERRAGDSTSMNVKQASGRCFYTHLPLLVKQHGVTGSALTTLNVDKSAELELILERDYGGSEDILLGELQFSFIAFLMGQSLESFGQWKSMVCLMLSCDEAPLTKRTRLFVKFLDSVCFQLQTGLTKSGLLETDVALADALMDNSWFSDDTFLRSRFREFYQLVTDVHPVDGDLLKQTRRLKGILESAIGWSFDNKEGDLDDDEYAPVVVPETELSGSY